MLRRRILVILVILVIAGVVSNLSVHAAVQKISDRKSLTTLETITITEDKVSKTEPLPLEVKPAETEPLEDVYVEKFPEVPLYFQNDYPNTPYGSHGTVSNSGCGVTSLAMVLTYLLDEEILPDALAKQYGRFNTEVGSSYGLFTQSAKDYGVTIEKQVYQWEDVVTALENGQVVIANPKAESIFTNGGHYIVLYGITDEGRILVRDPNKANYGEWSMPLLKEGFKNGFEQKSLKYHCFPCWIYAKKDLEALAAKTKEQSLVAIPPEGNS